MTEDKTKQFWSGARVEYLEPVTVTTLDVIAQCLPRLKFSPFLSKLPRVRPRWPYSGKVITKPLRYDTEPYLIKNKRDIRRYLLIEFGETYYQNPKAYDVAKGKKKGGKKGGKGC